MKAKDTVIDYDAIQLLVNELNELTVFADKVSLIRTELEAQTEITWDIAFKAGQEEESTQAYHAGLSDGRLKGIKEVAECFAEQTDFVDDETCPYYVMNKNVWRNQLKDWFKDSPDLLKEWGIEP